MVLPGSPATQWMTIENPTKVVVRLRLKITYTVGGQAVDEMAEFSAFDPSLWA